MQALLHHLGLSEVVGWNISALERLPLHAAGRGTGWGTEVLLLEGSLGAGDLTGRTDEAPLELQTGLGGRWVGAGWSSHGDALSFGSVRFYP